MHIIPFVMLWGEPFEVLMIAPAETMAAPPSGLLQIGRKTYGGALVLGLVLLAANIASAAAALQIPSQYHGEWCAISQLSPPPKEKWVNKRCRDRYDSDRGGIQVHARWYDSLESRCTVTKVTALRVGHQVQAKCKHETGEEWSVDEHWYFSADRLITVGLASEEDR